MSSIFFGEIQEHLALRQKELAPPSFGTCRFILLSFDLHLAGRGKTEKYISEDDVTSWIQPMYDTLSRNTIAARISFLRKFLEFLRFKKVPVYIPPSLKSQDNYVPYLFSDDEVRQIFEAADSLQLSYHAKSNIELPMLLRMLYSCGFRLSELLAVRVGDINFERGFVLLKTAKRRKQRIVPFGDALTKMLNRYCLAMDLMGSPENYIFPGRSKGTHLSRCWTEMLFRTILQNIGIYTRSDGQSRGPCLHCFRHLFAIKSFAQAEQAGRPVNDSIPFLSIYMWHNDLTETEKYLKFSSDMFPENTELFEAYTEGIFPEVLYED